MLEGRARKGSGTKLVKKGSVWPGSHHSWTALLFSPQAGGFYSAEDADSYPTATSSEKREGAFCVWAAEEVRALLPDPVEGAADGTTLGDEDIS